MIKPVYQPPLTLFLIRVSDILLAASALLVLLPVIVVIIIVLNFSGEREIFYCQTRVGRGGKNFGLLKFATMLKESPNIGSGELTIPRDPRVLPFGRLLRRTKLNELPQLLNILYGDMSFIGPRPQTPKYFLFYDQVDRAYIEQIRPGLSGVGSILFRDEEKIFAQVHEPMKFDEEVIIPYKGKVERWFVCNRSYGLYIKLIVITGLVVLLPGWGGSRKLLTRIPPPPEELKSFLLITSH